jgi:hypothetical protein
MPDEKIITLKLTEDGLEISTPKTTQKSPEPKVYSEFDIKAPRWNHWYQRKLARVWNATLLGMNIEPTGEARTALKFLHPERYQVYLDRLDIAKTLMGYDLPYYEDHVREGNSVGEKYVALVDYYRFTSQVGWTDSDLNAMKDGLQIDTSPSKPQELRQNQKNNLLVLLNEAWASQVVGFDVKDPGKAATAILKWKSTNKLRSPVEHRTLKSYLEELAEALKQFDSREKIGLSRIDIDRVQS